MRVVVAADRPVVGDGLASAVSDALRDASLRQVTTAQQCMQLVGSWGPDLVLTDLDETAPDRHLLYALLRETGVASVAVAGSAEEVLDLLAAGAGGVITAADGLDGVASAVRTVLGGNTYVPQWMLGEVLHALIERQRHAVASPGNVKKLSNREREVLALLGDGHDQIGIARRLAISPHTAKTHIRHVLTKLGVRSRVEAAALAAEAGLVHEGSAR